MGVGEEGGRSGGKIAHILLSVVAATSHIDAFAVKIRAVLAFGPLAAAFDLAPATLFTCLGNATMGSRQA